MFWLAAWYAWAGGCAEKFAMSYGQSDSGGAPWAFTLLIPSRIIAPLSESTVPSIARSL